MYALKFYNKVGREITWDGYETKDKANRHGDLLMMARETGDFKVVNTGVSDTPSSNAKNGEPVNGV